MSSDTDHPRQRTVAELLAAHGDSGATGRRRRRREADGPDEGGASSERADGPPATSPAPPEWRQAQSRPPDRSMLRESVPSGGAPPTSLVAAAPVADVPRAVPPVARRGVDRPQAPPTAGQALRSPSGAVPPDPARDRPTERMPRIREGRPGGLDPGLTGPIEHQRFVGAAPPVEERHRDGDPGGRADGASGVEAPGDAEPGVGAPAMNSAGTETRHQPRTSSRPVTAADTGPPTQAAAPPDFDDPPAGLADHDLDELDEGEAQDRPDRAPRRRRSQAASPGQAWMAVLGQWIAGALGGAALWVGFQLLWRGLPVVALAAAVLVTIGLVVVVRSLLHNDDRRTTMFAVLVGLLLTVSPAVVVLFRQ